MITRNAILSKVSTYDILAHFLKDYYGNLPIKQGVHIYVPEISGKQSSPSFNIYYSNKQGKSKEWRYKDFTGHDGSAFDLVMNLYNVSFSEALSIINQDMNLGLEAKNVRYEKVQPKSEPKPFVDRNYSYEIEECKWTKRHLEFWTKYGTGLETLRKYSVVPLNRLSAFRKDNTPFEIESGKKGLIFAYMQDGWCKYYIPGIKGVQGKNFGYLGKKPEGFVFGLEQLPETGDDLYLIAGEKDVINMHSHEMWAVCLTSEESTPKNYPKFMELIDSGRFKNCWICYDNDATGRRQMLNINSEIPKLKIKLLDIKEGKDISDYLMSEYSKLMF